MRIWYLLDILENQQFMRKRQIPIALLIASASPFASNAIADSAWQGSYSANGQCFCSGKVSLTIANRIVATPIGGQTVKQVCAAIGPGPELIKSGGLFNYPVFEDAQCGNGPFTSQNGPTDVKCVGSRDGVEASCQPAGPDWDLAQAFDSAPAASALAVAEDDDKDKTDSVASATGGDKSETQTSNRLASADADADASASASASQADNPSSLSGKSVMVGGERYFQAREGISSTGGASGSRIILDGLVYLKADENLAQADLYQVTEAAPKIAAASPEKPSSAVRAKQNQDQDSSRRARLALEEKQREQKALADYQAEQEARDVQMMDERKLAEQEKIAGQEKSAEQTKLAEQRKQPDQKRLSDEELLSNTPVADKEALAEASRQVESTQGDETLAAVMNALRMPEDTRTSSRDFGYIEAMPLMSYDIGGDGLMLEGSGQFKTRFQLLGRVGISDSYNEVMIGGGYYLTPAKATRMTVVMLAGVEHGSFELQDEDSAPGISLTSSDTGLFLGALSRLVINNKFEIKGGVGYSSFFGGDATLFGGGYYHLTPQLDVMSRFELGDNDSFGLGIRYYY